MPVTQTELAKALGVSTRTLERWARAGMPVLAQRAAYGRPRYDIAVCRKWAADQPTQGRRNPTRPTPDTLNPTSSRLPSAIRYPGVEGLEDTCRHLIVDALKRLAAGYKARQA